jgi:hypothetical protein
VRAALAFTLGTLLLACAACPFVPGEPVHASGVDAVHEALGPWRDLFEHLARRADAGDAWAARMALGMVLDGAAVYGTDFVATPSQLHAWRCRALGRELPCTGDVPAA